jgi:hypothetical protein
MIKSCARNADPMPSLYTETIINAPIRLVWRILTDKDRWMYWNTYLYDCSFGLPIDEGRTLLLGVRRVPGDEAIEFPARITINQPPHCLSWVASIPGYTNKTTFELQDLGHGCTQFRHREAFSGTFSRIALRFVRDDQQRGIRRMARELKTFAERSL